MRKLVFAALMGVSVGAHAGTKPFDGNWVDIFRQQDPNRTEYADYLYDTNSFLRNGEKISFWEKMILGDAASSFKVVSISHEILNCETQQHAQIAFISSGPDGILPTPDRMIEKEPVYKSYPPNSPGAKIVRFICDLGRS
ncbi:MULTISPECIES: hypothetical protein [Burkholderia]|uniref:hypothetical protein n=1 Tax=Burkholderia TaxID=32008 RepID=UPI0012D9F9BC|nr:MULTISPECIES: hypothetical protein [Burkholderia]